MFQAEMTLEKETVGTTLHYKERRLVGKAEAEAMRELKENEVLENYQGDLYRYPA